MTPRNFRPLRSRAFWFGVPGLLFLLWAWWRSNSVHNRLVLLPGSVSSTQGKLFWYELSVDGGHEVEVDFVRGDIMMSRFREGEFETRCYFGSPPKKFETSSFPVHTDQRSWFPPLRWRSEQLIAGNSYRFVSIPYWVPSASYAGAWICGLVVWQRRKARLVKLNAAP